MSEDRVTATFDFDAPGWFLKGPKGKVGPFPRLDEVDEVTVAEQIGADPKDVAKAIMTAPNPILEAPDPLEAIMRGLSRIVVRDEVTKRLVFLVGMSAYGPCPLNLFLRGPASSGKSYNATRTVKFAFPEEDYWLLGGLSPKALVHQKAQLVDVKTGKVWTPEDLKVLTKEEREEALRHAINVIDLSGKILVFLEAPEKETYRMLYPILSHDSKRVEYQFTDKTSKGQLVKRRVIIQGWPACIFCTTQFGYSQELTSRGITVTPELSKKKFEEALRVIADEFSLPKVVNPISVETKRAISHIRDQAQRLEGVLIPYQDELRQVYPCQVETDMRHFRHLSALIQASAIINVARRPYIEDEGGRRWLIATLKDLQKALLLWGGVERTTRRGVPGHVLEFYDKVVSKVMTKTEPLNTQALASLARERLGQPLSLRTVQSYLRELESSGLVDSEPDPLDRRRKVWRPVGVGSQKKPEISANSRIALISKLFTLNKLKSWLKRVQKYIHTRPLVYYRGQRADPDALYNILSAHTFLEGSSGKELGFSDQKKPEINALRQSALISTESQTAPLNLDRSMSPGMVAVRVSRYVRERGEVPQEEMLGVLRSRMGWTRDEAVAFLSLGDPSGKWTPERPLDIVPVRIGGRWYFVPSERWHDYALGNPGKGVTERYREGKGEEKGG